MISCNVFNRENSILIRKIKRPY